MFKHHMFTLRFHIAQARPVASGDLSASSQFCFYMASPSSLATGEPICIFVSNSVLNILAKTLSVEIQDTHISQNVCGIKNSLLLNCTSHTTMQYNTMQSEINIHRR